MGDNPNLFGVLVTFHRVEALESTLENLGSQSRLLDLLVVVDNGSDDRVKRLVETRSESITYIDAGDNLGPAGGYALGMEHLLHRAADDDWIFLLDDDDPPDSPEAFQKAEKFAAEMLATDSAVGCIGVSAGRFDYASGRVIRIGDSELTGAVPGDHVTGGGQPAYRVGAVKEVGLPRSELFFGFEELEYGLRLTEADFHIYADGPTWLARRQDKRRRGLLETDEASHERSTSNTLRLGPATWRRYYSMRNLIWILRQHDHSLAALKISMTRGILKPLINLFVTPGEATRHLRLNGRAIVDGWRDRLGRTVEPK